MRILIVSDISSFMRGGVPAETRMLLNGLVALGHAVALVSDARLPGSDGQHYTITLPTGESFVSEMKAIVQDFQPDFVHVICMNSKGVSLLAEALSGHRWALTSHSIPPYERKLSALHGNETLHYTVRALRFLPNSLLWRWIFSRQIAPLVIVHSEFVRDIALAYGCAAKRIALIPLPFLNEARNMPNRRLPVPAKDISIVCVGGLAHTKGQHDLLKAIGSLVARHQNVHCELIGEVRDESYLAFLKQLIVTQGIQSNVTISVAVDDEHKENALRNADVYVQPSHEEGFCLAFAEGASVVPRVVGTLTGAMRAMSDGDAGMRVVPARDAATLGKAITELIVTKLPPGILNERVCRLHKISSQQTYLRLHVDEYNRQR